MRVFRACLVPTLFALVACGEKDQTVAPANREVRETAFNRGGIEWKSADRTLSIDWIGRALGAEPEAAPGDESFKVVWRKDAQRIRVESFSASRGKLEVFHLRCDRPGNLEFEVRWNEAGTVQGRRVLVAGEARAWVFPMESDVATVDGAIRVNGEGEALVVAGVGEEPEAAMRELGVKDGQVADVMALLGNLVAARD